MVPPYEAIGSLPCAEHYRLDRLRDSVSGRCLLVKSVGGTARRAAAAEVLRRERALLSTLAVSGAPRLAAGMQDDQHLILEDPGGEPLADVIARGSADISLSLAVGCSVAETLAALHARKLVHNAIRPDALLWHGESGRAWVVDFAEVAVAIDRPPALPLGVPTSRLAYMSPEQTGRMNCGVDARSDFYALGVLLYELLTGAPPFRSDDALELIHWHVARSPLAPALVAPAVPRVLSDLVMKLLAKSPEERYRSAAGLYEDLDACARAWSAHGHIADFPLGRHELGGQFVVSHRLYGRDGDVVRLLRNFNRVCESRGRTALTLVAGYSGIGKSSLIQELYKPIVRQRGYFVSGKFDQVRSVPFGALIQALRALIRQILTESESRIARWRGLLADAVGANGGVLADVIPEIEFLIGKQPLTAVLGPTEGLNRFRMVFQNFIAALARRDHPLVIFLDDLQWADAATLSLFEPLLASPDIECLFLMGAYRDNEVDAAHPLMRTVGVLEHTGVEVQRIALGPLGLEDLSRLVRDTLCGNEAEARELAEMVARKTGGNPFFVTQFLKTLNDEGCFRFDRTLAAWTCDFAAIARAPLTDNVVDLMSRKLRRLPDAAQRVLTLAACIGNPFDETTLAVVSELDRGQVVDTLHEACNEGLILRVAAQGRSDAESEAGSEAYVFLHDRVQQAAYALIPDQRKQAVHLAVGRLLRGGGAAELADERLFDIVHHLNLGQQLIDGRSERLDVARLDLAAGRRAKTSTAHDAAAAYLGAGRRLLDASHWDSDYALCFSLHLEAAECEYLCGRFDAAEALFGVLLERAASDLDKARVYRLRSLQYENQSRYADALASARAGMALFGVSFPHSPGLKEAALETEMLAIQSLLGERSIASLVDLPLMTEPEIRMVMSIMTDIWASAYILGDPLLARLISATLVRLSLKFGNVEESAYGYVTHAITVGAVKHDYRAAYEFGRLALSVNERLQDRGRRAKIYQQFHAHVNFWCRPMASCKAYAFEASRSGLESGDFLYAAYGASTAAWAEMQATQDLDAFVRTFTPQVALVEKLKNTGFADSLKIIINWAKALQGRTRGPLSLSDETIDEAAYLAAYQGNAFFTAIHAVSRLQLCYLLGEPAAAVAAAEAAGKVVYQLAGTVWPLAYDFWNALTLAASVGEADAAQREIRLAEIERARQAFAELAQVCPENFRCPALLLGAELARLEGSRQDALEQCEQAIGHAEQIGALQQLALAHELCARLRLAAGQERIGALFMGQARAAYARLGAAAKVEWIDRRYGHLFEGEAQALPVFAAVGVPAAADNQQGDDAEVLDLASVIKAAQAIAGEIELGSLLGRLVCITMENAGAERGCLVLELAGERFTVAEGTMESAAVSIADAVSLGALQDLPVSILNYVRRTGEGVVLANADRDDRFVDDPYVMARGPLSIMCVPVVNLGRLVGVLYLENSMLQGAFTPARTQVVQLLAAEAAISLENAKLVEGLRREIHERGQAQQELRAALTEVERLKSELEAENIYLRRDLIVNVSHDLRTPLTSLRGYLETMLLNEDALSLADRHQYLEIAARQSEHLARLVDELFELARLDFKGIALNLEPVQLAELAHDVMQKFQLGADRKRIQLLIDVSQEIPILRGDVGLLERVFDNLIGNALKHTPEGGRVSVMLHSDGERVAVRVADTGNGIPAAEIPYVFNRFYRVDKSRSNAGGGAGLGLAIAKRIVELHGGEIAVDASASVGACFTFSLPLDTYLKQYAA